MKRSVETSCLISSFANILSKTCGLIGCIVVGSNGGGKGSGKSACMLYHCSGISSGFSGIKHSFVLLFIFSAPICAFLFFYVH